MELSNIQKEKHKKEIIISVRTTKESSEWLKKNNISPTLMFNEAIKDLKEKLIKNVRRDKCFICGKPSKILKLGLGMETRSFCSYNCMKQYTNKEENKKNLEVKGTQVFVK